MYKFKDDSFVINRQIARAKAIANKKIEFAKAAGSVVSANKKFLDERNSQRNKHGAAPVDAALNRLEGKAPKMAAYASEVEAPKAQGQNGPKPQS